MNRNLASPGVAQTFRISISFEPPDFEEIDTLIRHCIELKKADGVEYKTIAADAGLGPSEFSMMLRGTRPWQTQDLPGIIQATQPHGIKIVQWLVFRYLSSHEEKEGRAAAVVEVFMQQALPAVERAVRTLEEVQRARGKRR